MSSCLLSQDEKDLDNVGLSFVVPLNLEKEECSNDMKIAFQSCLNNELEPTWISEESCLSLEPTKRNVFVLEKFEGPAFDHLKQFKCCLVGPRCIHHCLLIGSRLPLVQHPTFTAAMKDLYITCSGGGVEMKKELRQTIELMSGTFLKVLNEKTTHVVVTSALSSKYEKAFELGIPVRTHAWVDAVWKKSLKEYIFATDAVFDKYKCPPFLDLDVCSSGLSIKETERIKNTVIKYGGTFHTSLRNGINILVIKHPKGDKFKYAQSWSIPCVTTSWIDSSVQNGHALPTKPFEVSGGRAASSPTNGDLSVTFSSNVSNIHIDNVTHVNQSMMDSSRSSIASFCPSAQVKTPVKVPPPPTWKGTPVKTPIKGTAQSYTDPGKLKNLLNELTLAKTKKAGSFLDGCGVYLVGWDSEEEEQLKKILKCSGAARFDELSDSVSHVLVGNLEKSFMRTMKSLPHKPHVVNIKWLIQSVSEKGPAPEEPFSCLPSDNTNVSEAPSPLSKKGMALLLQENFSPEKPLTIQNNLPGLKPSPNKGKQLLAKYRSSESLDKNVLSTSAMTMPPPPAPPRMKNNDTTKNPEDLFTGLTFVLVGLAEEITPYVEKDLIQKHGGKVVPKSFKGVPDYAIVPLTGASLHQTATDIITTLWLDSCIEQLTVVPVSYYHQPVVLDVDRKPLETCVLGLSGYSGIERNFILELASALGATCQDVFAKRAKSNAKASSHLICKTSEETDKFNAAIKWFRPAVYHSWLLACARSSSMAPITGHLVDPNQIIKPLENVSNTDISVANSSASIKHPSVAALQELSKFKTPERTVPSYDNKAIEKILSFKPSPVVSSIPTPPVLIGLSDNPTPGESKRIMKWINRLPGKQASSPSPPSRRDSTPLHELRKRVLARMAATTPELEQAEAANIGEESPKSANAMMENKLSSKNKPGISCSTPTIGLGSHTSRKLFEHLENDRSSPTEGNLEILKKLIATPEASDDNITSSKSSNLNQLRVAMNPENQRVYDAFKDGSQPYAIEWEDPVNLKRSANDHENLEQVEDDTEESGGDHELPEVEEIEHQNPFKRKSSESAVNTPDSKKSHVEVVQPPSTKKLEKVYKFSFSHIEAKEPHLPIIHKLGGSVLDSTFYNPEATHLLLGKGPQRSEKLLAFIAAGKWVLHISYLLESGKVGKFLKEEDFEWGNPCNNLMKELKLSPVGEALAMASYRWRTQISKNQLCEGAFVGFKCKIFTSNDKAEAFSRLVNAGGGVVLPVESDEKPSFCLVNLTSHSSVLADCAKKCIPCLPLTFLYEHLTVHPCPKPESRTFEEYNKLRKRLQSGVNS